MEDKDLEMHIELGDDGKYIATGIGNVTFEREKAYPLRLKYVMFVLRLKKNLIFVVLLEDGCYDVIFSKGKDFLRHVTTGKVKKIGVQVKNLYKLKVGECVALRSKEEKVKSQDVGELWHRKLGHLHHGNSKIMHQITIDLPKGSLDQREVCKDCTLGKYVKSTIHGRDRRAYAILE